MCAGLGWDTGWTGSAAWCLLIGRPPRAKVDAGDRNTLHALRIFTTRTLWRAKALGAAGWQMRQRCCIGMIDGRAGGCYRSLVGHHSDCYWSECICCSECAEEHDHAAGRCSVCAPGNSHACEGRLQQHNASVKPLWSLMGATRQGCGAFGARLLMQPRQSCRGVLLPD